MTDYKDYSRRVHAAKISDLLECDVNDKNSMYHSGQKIKIVAILSSVRKKITKSDTTMAFLQAEDVTGMINLIVFPKKFIQFAELLKEDNIVEIVGRLELSDDEDPKMSLDEITLARLRNRLRISGTYRLRRSIRR